MMFFIRNILYVSKYESKLLFRSWFFRIFAILAIAVLVIFNIITVLQQNKMWEIIAVPSNIPYINMLILNTGQAVIAIFLASDFLKRDKKLDTSEIFYVRPLSNAEYVFGKIWGNLRIFFILNLIAIAITITFTIASPDTPVDLGAYILYFLIISIPTLIYIIGLSVFLMLILRNQAITFVLLLGYIGATLFYLNDKFYYLFDYMVYYLPIMKSTIVGLPNLQEIIIHRSIYLFAGLTCIFITIPLFGRLPNSSKSSYPWIILSLCTLLTCASLGYIHVSRILQQNENRLLYTQINNKYVHTPKMVIEQYDISVKQNPKTFESETKMTGIALSSSQVFTFCLNPGLEIETVKSKDKTLDFKREEQIFLINFGKEIHEGDTVSLSVTYRGKLNNSFCYLDIPKEKLNETNKKNLVSIDKQYSFQTDNYMLLTPETYWYPRPGTGYSDESPDWQQTYFSRFVLNVTPLQGLVPLSQGERTENADGSYSFSSEYPIQAISLATGKYRQKSFVRDSIRYSLWHIEGNDVLYATALDSICDTIPAIVQNAKENIERQYELEYPFKCFSLVEVPAQFFCYPHAWSQAQETIQPEIVFFVERAYNMYQMNIKKNVANNQKWGRISLKEAQMWSLNSIIHTFTNPIGNYSSSSNRGSFNITSEANPYFIFPQFFNFRYNIFSTDWPIANRLIELYLQNNLTGQSREREINGISNSEKASILLKQHTFRDLLADAEYQDLMNHIVGLKAFQLFAPAEINIGIRAFRDSLYAVLNKYTFRNMQLENLLDTMGKISETDILSSMSAWNDPAKPIVYSVEEPEVINVNERGKDFFVLKIVIRNNSDSDGIVQLNLQIAGERNYNPQTDRKIKIPARRSMQLTSIWESMPINMTINTMISRNLPMIFNVPLNTAIKRENRRLYEKDEEIILPVDYSDVVPNEVIVDNEDSTLFTLSQKPVIGLLPKLLDNVEDTQFKYSGFSWWNTPLQWTANTHDKYYGKYIRSAYVVRSLRTKGGNQTATWKIPVPSPGQYELYYYMFINNDIKNNRRWNNGSEYRFKIQYGEDIEDAYIDILKAHDGWEQLGIYYFASDTVSVTLSNECKARYVIADAVKIVKR